MRSLSVVVVLVVAVVRSSCLLINAHTYSYHDVFRLVADLFFLLRKVPGIGAWRVTR